MVFSLNFQKMYESDNDYSKSTMTIPIFILIQKPPWGPWRLGNCFLFFLPLQFAKSWCWREKLKKKLIISLAECQCFQIERATSDPGLSSYVPKHPGKCVSLRCPLETLFPSDRIQLLLLNTYLAASLHTLSLFASFPVLATLGKVPEFHIKCIHAINQDWRDKRLRSEKL